MKPSELQKLIKEAVKEAIAEELKDILLEAIRAPKQQIVTEAREIDNNGDDRLKLRENMMNILGDMGGISMNSSHAQSFTGAPGYTPSPSANTAAQGSALPPGEVNMDQIMGFIKKA
jgi:hypothetical protein|tara:strand:- start:507 stop:857 length:351 start_codon:yes stop_codon:yes gene_type:complete